MARWNPKKIRQCIDRYPLDADQVSLAAKLAIDENPVNAPFAPRGPQADPLQLALLTNTKWAVGRVLRIAFLDGSAAKKAEVRAQAEQWLPYVNLTFKWDAPPANAEIRISFAQLGAWSYIGTDCLSIRGSEPTMNFGFLQAGTAIHEFGHALGCIHEHQSPGAGVIPWDKERVYRYYSGPPNNWSRATIDSNIFERYATAQTQYTEWDRGSIMEYPIDADLVTDPSYAVDWNTTLSKVDREYIGTVYPRGANPPPPAGKSRQVIISFEAGKGTVQIDGKPA